MQTALSPAEAGAGKVQLRAAIWAIGWLYAVAGQPLPAFIGTVIVPAAEKRRAERALRPHGRSKLALPQGLGCVAVEWQVSWV